MPRVAWTKPRFLYWRDLKAFKSEDVAALMIQNQWHAYKARQFMMNAVRAQYTVKTDPLTGRLMYTNVHTHKRGFKKPPLLGSEELDPEDMSLWGIYRLGVFFRRLGYGFIAPELRRLMLCGNHHRRDVVPVTASARWRGDSTPSTRRRPRDASARWYNSLVDFHTGIPRELQGHAHALLQRDSR